MNCSQVLVSTSVEEIVDDIRSTTDPIRKTILKRILEFKIIQQKAINDDPSLSNENDNNSSNNIIDNKNINIKVSKNKDAKTELKRIIAKQKKGLSELDKVEKIKAYVDILDTNQKENDRKIILAGRNSKKAQWDGENIYDPRYVKYQKDDTMNNKLMERLNSEIDFRLDDDTKVKIIKPFGYNEDEDITDEYARYVPPKNEYKI
jgi:hypothetical protein